MLKRGLSLLLALSFIAMAACSYAAEKAGRSRSTRSRLASSDVAVSSQEANNAPSYDDQPGAASVEELCEILTSSSDFSRKKVMCMGQEFLCACIVVCDHVNFREIYERLDYDEIADLLNEKLYESAGVKPFTYSVSDYETFGFNDEMREKVVAFFEENSAEVKRDYGEIYFQRVQEENRVTNAIIYPKYKTVDQDGIYSDELDGWADQSNLDYLGFRDFNGRYYWADFSLFQNIDQ